jgi:hypothetical protein
MQLGSKPRFISTRDRRKSNQSTFFYFPTPLNTSDSKWKMGWGGGASPPTKSPGTPADWHLTPFWCCLPRVSIWSTSWGLSLTRLPYFRCQSQIQIMTCASDQLTKSEFPQCPSQVHLICWISSQSSGMYLCLAVYYKGYRWRAEGGDAQGEARGKGCGSFISSPEGHPLAISTCSTVWKLSKVRPFGVLLRLHYMHMIDYIIDQWQSTQLLLSPPGSWGYVKVQPSNHMIGSPGNESPFWGYPGAQQLPHYNKRCYHYSGNHKGHKNSVSGTGV